MSQNKIKVKLFTVEKSRFPKSSKFDPYFSSKLDLFLKNLYKIKDNKIT